MKSVESRLKPYYGLRKIDQERACPSVLHKDSTILYKFCSNSAYVEFACNNMYHHSNNDYKHYQIGTSQVENFYDESMIHFLDQKFAVESMFETVVNTKTLLGIVRSLDLKSDSLSLKHAVDVKLVNDEIHLGCNPSLSDWSSQWVTIKTGESFNEGNCCFRINVRYLKLAFNHGYEFTKVRYIGCNKQILFYGYDDTQSQNFRMLVMPIATAF